MVAPSESDDSVCRAPTLNADCHISNKGARPTDELLAQATHSQVYSMFNLQPVHLSCLFCVIIIDIVHIIRLTPKSRPNKVGLRCPSVRPQKVFPIPMKFGMWVEVDK